MKTQTASPSVSLHQLRLFVTLARHCSFTRAGDEFGITQSAVSRGIRELEDELALRLFDRTTRQVTLTETGRGMLARVAPLVEELEAALRPREASRTSVVTLATSSALTAGALPSMLASCGKMLPDITVILLDRPQRAVLQLVRSGEADLGIVIAPDDLDELSAEPLFDDGFTAVVDPSHKFSAMQRLEWQQLRGHSLLLLDDDTGSLAAIEAVLALHAVEAALHQRLTQPAGIARMAQAGLGIGILPMHARAACDGSALHFIPLAPDAARTVMLVRRRSRTFRSSAAQVWAQFSAHASLALHAVEA